MRSGPVRRTWQPIPRTASSWLVVSLGFLFGLFALAESFFSAQFTRLDILLEFFYSHLECLLKNRKGASSCFKALVTTIRSVSLTVFFVISDLLFFHLIHNHIQLVETLFPESAIANRRRRARSEPLVRRCERNSIGCRERHRAVATLTRCSEHLTPGSHSRITGKLFIMP